MIPRDVAPSALALMALDDPDSVVAYVDELMPQLADPITLGHLHNALAVAAMEKDTTATAVHHAQTAGALAAQAGDDGTDLLAAARSTLSWANLVMGNIEEAIRLALDALPDLSGEVGARTHFRLGLAYQRNGQHAEAIASYEQAEGALPDVLRCRLLLNRGVLHTYEGRRDEALADLHTGRQLAQRCGQHLAAAGFAQNLGFLEARAGNLADALVLLRDAREQIEALDVDPVWIANVDLDEARVLAQAGLLREARDRAGRAAETLSRSGRVVDAAEATLQQARHALAEGDPSSARELADAARAAFESQGRSPWVEQARVAGLMASVARLRVEHMPAQPAGSASAAARHDIGHAIGACDELASAGWTQEVEEARIDLALAAVGHDLPDIAHALRDGALMTSRLSTARWRYVDALLVMDSDMAIARQHLEAGLAELSDAWAALPSAELRARWTGHAHDLTELLLRLALDDDDPRAALRAVDAWRGRSTLAPPVRASSDPLLVGLTLQLRQATQSEMDARLSAQTDAAIAAGQDRRELEDAIIHRSRAVGTAPRTASARALPGPTAPSAVDWISESDGADPSAPTLATFVLTNGHVDGIRSGAGGHTVHRRLLAEDELHRLLGRVTFSLQTLCRPSTIPAMRAAAATALLGAADELDRAIVRPLIDPDESRLDGGRTIWLCPPGALLAAPWVVLPSLRQRANSLLPSLRRTPVSALGPVMKGRANVLVVGGPGLASVDEELAAICQISRTARALSGERATAAATLEALNGADLAHIAAHGFFRSDNARFSTFQLHDGPLTVHELEALTSPPKTVVLSVCHGARTEAAGGDDILGLAAALLRSGVRTLIAPVVAVPDEATVPVMVELHRHLHAGATGPEALRRVRQTFPDPTDLSGAAALAFVCIEG